MNETVTYMRGYIYERVCYLITAGAHNKSSNRTRMKSKANKVLNRPTRWYEVRYDV